MMNDTQPESPNETNIPDWAHKLETMRRQRQVVQTETTVDKVAFSDTIQSKPEPRPQPTEAERDLAYQRYLQSWQRQHNIAIETAQTDNTHLLFGDEWQQECDEILAHEKTNSDPTVLLKLDIEPDVAQSFPTHAPFTPTEQDLFKVQDTDTNDKAQTTPPCYVNVIAPPLDTDMRVAVMDETLLMQQLQEKLRPHLSDAVAGVVKTSIQKHLHALIQALQTEIPQELEPVVDEIIQLHLCQALDQIKTTAGIVKKMS